LQFWARPTRANWTVSDPSHDKNLPSTEQLGRICLAFHKVSSGLSFGVTNYSPQRFEKLLGYLIHSGFCLRDLGSGSEPRLSITFDDGYMHLADLLPELSDRYSFQPLVFVPTFFIGKTNSWDYSHLFRKVSHLDRNSISRLSKAGVLFGSHGHRHLDLRFQDLKIIREELTVSKAILEDIIGREVIDISYPFGRQNQDILDIAAECGYRRGFTMSFPSSNDNPLAQGRVAVYGFDRYRTVVRKLSGGGLLYRLERLKSGLCNQLSFGTVLLNRWFPRKHF